MSLKLLPRKLSCGEVAAISAAGLFVRVMHLMTRYDVKGSALFEAARATGRPGIVVIWHEDLVNLLMSTRKIPFGEAGVMVSQSRDGDQAARAVEDFGMTAIRGSSSSGGMRALVQMKRYLTQPTEGRGRLGSIALDGPRGPRREAKPGAAMLARTCDAFIFPIVFKNSREWVFRSWDRTRLIKPFAKMTPIFLEPIDSRLWRDDESLTREVERVLNGEAAHGPEEATARE